MFFGKYLIDQELITYDKLIEALVEQEKSQRSFFEIAIELDLLKIKSIPDLINDAIEQSVSIQQLLINNNLLSKENLDQIEKIKSSSGLALGSALVSIGAIEIDKLNLALKDYLTLKKEHSTNPQIFKNSQEIIEPEISQAALDSLKELNIDTSNIVAEQESQKSLEPEISQAALDSLKELGIGGDELLTESESQSLNPPQSEEEKTGLEFTGVSSDYPLLFTESYFKEIEIDLKSLKSGFNETILMGIHEKLTLLLGAASLDDFEYSVKILKCYQKAIENSVQDKNSNILLNFLPFVSKSKEALGLLWDLRSCIYTEGSEDKLHNDLEWKAVFFNNLKNIITLLKG